jgi:hypothetical protein
VDAYHRMGEAGILHPADRIELIDGDIVEMAPVGSPYIGAVFALNRLLTQTAPQGHYRIRPEPDPNGRSK